MSSQLAARVPSSAPLDAPSVADAAELAHAASVAGAKAASAARDAAGRARAAAPARLRRILLALLLPVTALLAIELAVRTGLIPANLLPAPTQIVDTMRDFGAQGLLSHITASTLRVAAGFASGAALAVLLGATVGLSRHAEAMLDPTFQALRAIPSLAWVPLLLLWLGIDEAPKMYKMFRDKQDDCTKVVLDPWADGARAA